MSLANWRRPDVWPHVARTQSVADRIDEATEEWWPGAAHLWRPPAVGSTLLLLAPAEQRRLAGFFDNLHSVTGGWPYRAEWAATGDDLALQLVIPGPGYENPAELNVRMVSRLGRAVRHVEATLTLETVADTSAVWFVEMLPAVEPFAEWV